MGAQRCVHSKRNRKKKWMGMGRLLLYYTLYYKVLYEQKTHE